MSSSSTRKAFAEGAWEAIPFLLIVIPFGLLFGIAATEAGLDFTQLFAFSALVFAGASQFAALQQMSEAAPTLVVVLTGLAVNLRMAIYSAALVPHFGTAPLWKRAIVAYLCVDQSYAMTVVRFERAPELDAPARFAYFIGAAIPVATVWFTSTWIGAVAGARIPPEYGIDFALPLAFIAMVAPMLRTLAHVVAALVSVTAALTLYWLPAQTGLLAAGILAMIAGAWTEVRMERAAAR